VLYDRHYNYDTVGNVGTIVNKLPTANVTQTYTYDHRDRLTRWQENGSPTWVYPILSDTRSTWQ
jgi:hypothetical protein